MIIYKDTELDEVLPILENQEFIAFDTETNSLNVREAKIIGISIASKVGAAYIVLREFKNGEMIEHVSDAAIKTLLNKLKSHKLIMHNASYDIQVVLNHLGIDLIEALHADTMLLAHILDENKFSYGLKQLAAAEFGADAKDEQTRMKASIKANGGKDGEIYKADANLIAEYGRKDAELTLKLFELYDEKLKTDAELYKFFYEDETMPLLKHVTIPMISKGIPVDVQYLKQSKIEIEEDLNKLEHDIQLLIEPHLSDFKNWWLNNEYPLSTSGEFFNTYMSLYAPTDWPKTKAGGYTFTAAALKKFPHLLETRAYKIHEGLERFTTSEIVSVRNKLFSDSGIKYMFNPLSKHHLKKLLFDKLGEEALSYTDKGNPQVDDELLDVLADKYEWVKLLRTYNKLIKIQSTYIDKLKDTSENGIIYFEYFQHRTTSGRYAGNAQQLPRIKSEEDLPDELARKHTNKIRNFIVSAPGWKLVDADFSSLEVVVFASDAQDKALLDVINNKYDLYSQVAINVNNLGEQFSANKKAPNFLKNHRPELRQAAKAFSLGFRYGLGAYKLSKDLNIPENEAQRIYNNYFSAYPRLKQRMDEIILSAKTTGQIRSKAGRVRNLQELPALISKWGEELFDGLALWKKYNEMPRVYSEAKQAARIAKNLLNNALNFPIQSLAASIVSQSSIAIMREFKECNMKAYIALSVHDELCIHCPDEEVETVKEIMQRRMENTIKLEGVPLEAEPIVGTRYGEVK